MSDGKVHSYYVDADSVPGNTRKALLGRRSGVGTTHSVVTHATAGISDMFSKTPKKEGVVSRPADREMADSILSEACYDDNDGIEEEGGSRSSGSSSSSSSSSSKNGFDLDNDDSRNKDRRNHLAAEASQQKASDPAATLCPTPPKAVGAHLSCAASAADVTSAFLCPPALDMEMARQRLGATVSASSPALVAHCPPSAILSPIIPVVASSPATEPRTETAPWPADLLSVIRALVQQEVGRADQPDELVTRLLQGHLPLPVTPHSQADSTAPSAATVIPKAVEPAASVEQSPGACSTKELEALRFQPGSQFSPPSSSPIAVCSPSISSSVSSTSLSSSSSSSHLSPLSSPASQSSYPSFSAATPEICTKVEPASPRVTARLMSSSRPSSSREHSHAAQTRPTADSSSPLPSPRMGLPAEHRSSVHFHEPFVSSTSAAGNEAPPSARSGSGGDRQSGEARAAANVPSVESVELTPVDQKWGVLFDKKGQATGRFTEVMHSLARFIIEKHLPEGNIVIVPEKLASFYSFPDGGLGFYTALFRSPRKDPYRKISELYQDLGCSYHLVQSKPASRPNVPALTPSGFARWMTLNAQAFPDEEARRLDRVVSASPLEARSALDGKLERLPRQLSRYLFPSRPDYYIRDLFLQAVRRHFGESCFRGGGGGASSPVPPPTTAATASPSQRSRRPSASFPDRPSLSPRDAVSDWERTRRESVSRGRPSSVCRDGGKEDEGRRRSERDDSRRSSHSQRSRRSPSRTRPMSQSKVCIAGGDRQPSSPTSRRASFASSTGAPVIVKGSAGPAAGVLLERQADGPRVRSYASSYPEVAGAVGSRSNESRRRTPYYGPSGRTSTDYVGSHRYEETAHTHSGRDRDRERDRDRDRDRDRNAGRSRETDRRMSGVPNGADGLGLSIPAADPSMPEDLLLSPHANTRRRARAEGVAGDGGREGNQTWDDFLRRSPVE